MSSTEVTLAGWQAQLQAARPDRPAGVINAQQLAGQSVLQVMQAWLRGDLPVPHIGKTLGFALVEVSPGHAVFQGTPLQVQLNPLGAVHGSWYATLLDSALGCSVHTTLPPGRDYTTGQLGVHIVRGATLDTGPLRAIGQVLHSGRQMATAEARIVGPDGRLYAHATTTCLVFDLRPD